MTIKLLTLLAAAQAMHAATPADTYIQQVNGLVASHRSSIARLNTPATLTANALLSGGSIYLGNNGDQASFYENSGRSGGLMQILQYTGPSSIHLGDVLWITYTSKSYTTLMTTAAAVQAIGATVIAFGPQVPSGYQTPPNWVDSLTPWTSDDDYTLLGNVLSIWSVTGELAAATARRGKTLVFWQSISVPSSTARNAHYSGVLFHTGVPQMSANIQAGTLSGGYLDYVASMLTRIQTNELPSILAAGQILAQRAAAGTPVTMLTASHIIPFVPSLPNQWMQYLGDSTQLPSYLARSGYLLDIGYAGVDLESWRTVRLQPGAGATWIQTKVPAQADFTYYGDTVINEQWDYGDCTVQAPGYDVCILPASGVSQLFIYELLIKTAAATTGGATTLTALSGSGQSAVVGNFYPQSLQAKLTDSGGNGIANASVVFTAPSTGPSAYFNLAATTAVATTNASGIATISLGSPNGLAGSFTVTATSSGISTPASFSITNLAGPAAAIAATGGTPQSAPRNTAFPLALQATVKDSYGNPVSGASVGYFAPSLGPTCSFPGGTNTATATSNSSGVAVSPTCTANGAGGGPYQVAATVAGVATSAYFLLTNTPAAANSITAFAGNSQSAVAGTAFATALQAFVTDGVSPLSNITVTFTAPSSGASGTFPGGVTTATAVTNSQGLATSPILTANSTAGSFTVTASTNGLAALFSLTNTAAVITPPTQGPALTVVSGSGQSALPWQNFATPLAVKLTNNGVAMAGVAITFRTPTFGAGCFLPGGIGTLVVNTDANGLAYTGTVTANSVLGSYVLTADGNGLHAAFSLTNGATSTPTLAVTNGGTQSATVNTAFAQTLQVKLTDGNGNPSAGVGVVFQAPTSGPSGTFANGLPSASAITDSQGLAAAAFTAGPTAASYIVTATANGLTVNFNLTNTAVPTVGPGQLTAVQGTPQSAPVNTSFPQILQAKLTDANSNPIASAVVTFTAPTSGATGTFGGASATTVTALTNVQGIATAAFFTANGTAGSYQVTASNGGLSTQFLLTNTAGGPPGSAALTPVSGGGQTVSGTYRNFGAPLTVKLTDASGNPVAGIPITFRTPTFGAGCFLPGGLGTQIVITDSNGLASTGTVTSNSVLGSYVVTADGNSLHAEFALSNTP